jgi:hypothetical protein
MLHAELHGKLASDIGDAERREDVLTSTVFGTLFTANAWDILVEWFLKARRAGTAPPFPSRADVGDYWFWPRLQDAEPDLLVHVANLLVIIEAKYYSGKSGSTPLPTSPNPVNEDKDQLVREWHACSPTAETSKYDPMLRAAVERCTRVLLYLVRRSRIAPERDALEESAARVPDAQMYLLTWEDLDEVLATRLHIRWANDLHQYLQRRDLGAFRGFNRTLRREGMGPLLQVWAGGRAPTGFPNTIRESQPLLLARLASRPSALSNPSLDWKRFAAPENLGRLKLLAMRSSRFPE